MTELYVCRVCLCDDSPMYTIANTELQEIWENLLNIKLHLDDGKPIMACHLCRARLINCGELRRKALKSEILLTEIIVGGEKLSHNSIRLIDRTSNKLRYNLAWSAIEQEEFSNVYLNEKQYEKVHEHIKVEESDEVIDLSDTEVEIQGVNPEGAKDGVLTDHFETDMLKELIKGEKQRPEVNVNRENEANMTSMNADRLKQQRTRLLLRNLLKSVEMYNSTRSTEHNIPYDVGRSIVPENSNQSRREETDSISSLNAFVNSLRADDDLKTDDVRVPSNVFKENDQRASFKGCINTISNAKNNSSDDNCVPLADSAAKRRRNERSLLKSPQPTCDAVKMKVNNYIVDKIVNNNNNNYYYVSNDVPIIEIDDDDDNNETNSNENATNDTNGANGIKFGNLELISNNEKIFLCKLCSNISVSEICAVCRSESLAVPFEYDTISNKDKKVLDKSTENPLGHNSLRRSSVENNASKNLNRKTNSNDRRIYRCKVCSNVSTDKYCRQCQLKTYRDLYDVSTDANVPDSTNNSSRKNFYDTFPDMNTQVTNVLDNNILENMKSEENDPEMCIQENNALKSNLLEWNILENITSEENTPETCTPENNGLKSNSLHWNILENNGLNTNILESITLGRNITENNNIERIQSGKNVLETYVPKKNECNIQKRNTTKECILEPYTPKKKVRKRRLEKQLLCYYCPNKKFKRNKDWNRHMQFHSAAMFRCHHCDYSTAIKRNLIHHIGHLHP